MVVVPVFCVQLYSPIPTSKVPSQVLLDDDDDDDEPCRRRIILRLSFVSMSHPFLKIGIVELGVEVTWGLWGIYSIYCIYIYIYFSIFLCLFFHKWGRGGAWQYPASSFFPTPFKLIHTNKHIHTQCGLLPSFSFVFIYCYDIFSFFFLFSFCMTIHVSFIWVWVWSSTTSIRGHTPFHGTQVDCC